MGVTIQPAIVGTGFICLFLLSPQCYPQAALTLMRIAQSQPQELVCIFLFLWPQLVPFEDIL